MNNTAASIVVLAGAVLISVGMVVEAIKGNAGISGYLLGVPLLSFGLWMIVAPAIKQWWESIPVDKHDQKPPVDQ